VGESETTKTARVERELCGWDVRAKMGLVGLRLGGGELMLLKRSRTEVVDRGQERCITYVPPNDLLAQSESTIILRSVAMN